MADIIDFPDTETTEDIPADRVLDAAKDMNLDNCSVIGIKGDKFYFAMSTGDILEILMQLELAKQQLVRYVAEQFEEYTGHEPKGPIQ